MGQWVSSHWSHTRSHCEPWTAGNGRLECRHCSRDRGVRRIALSGTPGSAAYGTKPPALSDVEVGVVGHVYLKTQP
jgi:hypothetical protein